MRPGILITGAHGRLGRLLVPLLAARFPDVEVVAPRSQQVDACRPEDLVEWTRGRPIALFLALAASTNVDRCEHDPRYNGENIALAASAVSVATRLAASLIWASTDYVFHRNGPHLPMARPDPGTAYGRGKAEGERFVVSYGLGCVARFALLHREDVAGYRWLNGYTRSSREWSEQTAARLVDLVAVGLREHYLPPIVHLGPLGPAGGDITVATLVGRTDLPILTDRAEIQARIGYDPPADTRLAGCWEAPSCARA